MGQGIFFDELKNLKMMQLAIKDKEYEVEEIYGILDDKAYQLEDRENMLEAVEKDLEYLVDQFEKEQEAVESMKKKVKTDKAKKQPRASQLVNEIKNLETVVKNESEEIGLIRRDSQRIVDTGKKKEVEKTLQRKETTLDSKKQEHINLKNEMDDMKAGLMSREKEISKQENKMEKTQKALTDKLINFERIKSDLEGKMTNL